MKAKTTNVPERRCLSYPMALLPPRKKDYTAEEVEAALLPRLPSWASNPVFRGARQTSPKGWWQGVFEVDAPPVGGTRYSRDAADAALGRTMRQAEAETRSRRSGSSGAPEAKQRKPRKPQKRCAVEGCGRVYAGIRVVGKGKSEERVPLCAKDRARYDAGELKL